MLSLVIWEGVDTGKASTRRYPSRRLDKLLIQHGCGCSAMVF